MARDNEATEDGGESPKDPLDELLRLAYGRTIGRPGESALDIVRDVAARATAESTGSLMDRLCQASGGRFEPIEIVGVGGMGIVLLAKDRTLGREVAIKTLPALLAGRALMRERFLAEASVAARLEHPGVVPVYDLITPDGHPPFFTMKFIRGETLAKVLRDRDHEGGTRGLLGVMLQVCQAVAYAHSHGILHRDLKPSNIMIGSFGEVNVVDWGLSKFVAGELQAADSSGESSSDRSVYGVALGTASYMAPEQARGEVDRIDARADVFALGAILREILTHEPLYTGGSPEEVLKRATRGVSPRAMRRLEATGMPRALTDLVASCLASVPDHRPLDAGAVARDLGAFIESEEERARRSALEAVEARAQARQERQARRFTLVVGLGALGVVATGAIVALRLERGKVARASSLAQAIAPLIEKAEVLCGDLEAGGSTDPARWRLAQAWVDEAISLSGSPDTAPELAGRAERTARRVHRAFELAMRDEELRRRLSGLVDLVGHDPRSRDIVQRYEEAFLAAGVDLSQTEPASASLDDSSIKPDLAHALDSWRRALLILDPESRRIGAINRLAARLDPDARRNDIRRRIEERDRDGLRSMAQEPDGLARGLETNYLLARALDDLGDVEASRPLFRALSERFPGDFRVHHDLAQIEMKLDPEGPHAVRLLSMCVALRPTGGHAYADLARAQQLRGEWRESVRTLCLGLRADPCHVDSLTQLSMFLLDDSMPDLGLAVSRRWAECEPESAYALCRAAQCLSALYRYEEAEALYRRVVELYPRHPTVREERGYNFVRWGDYAAALRDYEVAGEVDAARADQVEQTRRLAEVEAMLRRGDPVDLTDWRAQAAVAGVRMRAGDYLGVFHAFEEGGLPADEQVMSQRYVDRFDAALAGLAAGLGLDRGGATLDDAERGRVRRTALQWWRHGLELVEPILHGDDGAAAWYQMRGFKLRLTAHPLISKTRSEAHARLDAPEAATWDDAFEEAMRLAEQAEETLDPPLRALFDEVFPPVSSWDPIEPETAPSE